MPKGYTGGSVWGSSVIPDLLRRVVYITTGNNYTTPTAADFNTCVNGRTLTEEVTTSCLSSEDEIDSIVALDMKSGTVKWSHRLWTMVRRPGDPAAIAAGGAAGPQLEALNRRAFEITEIDDRLMAIAAISGLNNQPVRG